MIERTKQERLQVIGLCEGFEELYRIGEGNVGGEKNTRSEVS